MIKNLLLLTTALFSISAFATPVNINTADAKTIADSLSGIGLKKAEVIIEYRNKNGAFKSLDDLKQVSGIGDKTIEKNKADILLDDSAAPAATDSTKQPEQPATAKSADKTKTNSKSGKKN